MCIISTGRKTTGEYPRSREEDPSANNSQTPPQTGSNKFVGKNKLLNPQVKMKLKNIKTRY